MSFSNWRCKLNRRVRLIKKMFGFGPKLKTSVGPVDTEDLKKRKFLEWHLNLVSGQKKSIATTCCNCPDSNCFLGQTQIRYRPPAADAQIRKNVHFFRKDGTFFKNFVLAYKKFEAGHLLQMRFIKK